MGLVLSGKKWTARNVESPKVLGAICSAINGTQAKNQPVSSRYKQIGEAG